MGSKRCATRARKGTLWTHRAQFLQQDMAPLIRREPLSNTFTLISTQCPSTSVLPRLTDPPSSGDPRLRADLTGADGPKSLIGPLCPP